MRNLSSEFKQLLAENRYNYLTYADITLASGVVLNLTNEHIWNGGFIVEDAISDDNTFTALGSVIIGSAELLINNLDDNFSEYDFTNATVLMRVGLQLTNTVETITFGTYTVDTAEYNGATIHLYMLDALEQLDRPYSLCGNSGSANYLSYPATLSEIAYNACLSCGLILNSLNFPNKNYVVSSRPEDESITFREVLSWVATIAGCYVKADSAGHVELKEFNTAFLGEYNSKDLTFNPWNNDVVLDGGTFNPWNTGSVADGGTFDDGTRSNVVFTSTLYSQNIAVDDVVITGVSVVVKDESESSETDLKRYTSGSSGYVIEVTDNPFITVTTGQQIANFLGARFIGLQFRKLNITHRTDPSIEVGDIAVILDRKHNSYVTIVTRVVFSADGPQTLVCGASTPSRNSATRYSSQTKSYVESRKLLKQEMTAREAAVQELAAAIASNSGLYTTAQTASSGTIYYMHDKPNLADSRIVWKMTAEAWAVTTNYTGATTQWNAGVTVNGTVIANILNTNGVNADWIRSGSLTLQGSYGSTGSTALRILDDGATFPMLLVDKYGMLGRDVPIVCMDAALPIGQSRYNCTYLDSASIEFGTTSNPNTANKSNITNVASIGHWVTIPAGEHEIRFISTATNTALYFGQSDSTTDKGIWIGNNSGGRKLPYSGNVYTNIVSNTSYYIKNLYCDTLYCTPANKSCFIETDDYGTRLQYTYETASPYFGDIGDAETDESGICYVQIDDVLRETTSEDTNYSVFLQKEGPGDIWIDTKAADYFIVKGTPNLHFSWEIKMRQKGGYYKRLELLSEDTQNDIDYAFEAEQMYEKYLKGMEV